MSSRIGDGDTMPDKKMPGRFTLQFNLSDPQQKEVSDCLERQGRRKTQFITNAVLHYLNCDRAAKPDIVPLKLTPALQASLMKMLSNEAAIGGEEEKTHVPLELADAGGARQEASNELHVEETDYSALRGSMREFDKI